MKLYYKSSEKKIKVFFNLKEVFAKLTFLAYYNVIRRLFIDLNVFKT